MSVRWWGVSLVLLLVVCTLLLKSRMQRDVAPTTVNVTTAVVLVADFREADDPNDRCADIIRAVRQASRRGVSVVS